MSYTKGPLKAEYQKHCVYFVLNEKKQVVAECYGQNHEHVKDTAILFSAAPDLVEALADLVEEIRYRGLAKNIKKDFSLMNYLVQAEKALTRAKGGQA